MIAISMSTYLSIHHAKSAARSVRAACQLEPTDLDRKSEIATNVGASIFFSVAFMEATANELFAAAERNNHHWLINLDARSVRLIKVLYETDSIEKSKILDKFNILLTAANLEPIAKGDTLYQNSQKLIGLRNNLTHYKAPWLDAASDESLMRAGSSHRNEGAYWKEMNRFVYGRNADEKPQDWEHKEYGIWALTSSIKIVDEVFRRLGVPSNINHVREELRFNA